MDRDSLAGQHLATGFAGYEITPEYRECVRRYHIGNVILFENNVKDKEQLKRLCGELTELIGNETGYPPLICIDQEGGAVSRLKGDATVFPSAMAFAAADALPKAREAGRITARELRAMGVNFNLAPVMDVNSNPDNPVIGTRSYGDDPAAVAAYGVETAKGLEEGGVLCAVKHFPGHGDTAVDSHLGLPSVRKTLRELQSCDLIPFQAAADAGVPAVMTTHILFPVLEPDPIPATMSRRIITGLLKEQIGFQGLVVSDCMMMGAIREHYGTVEGSVAAVKAGVDLLFVSHSAETAGQVIERLQNEIAKGEIDRKEWDASTQKILACKAGLPAETPPLSIVGCAEHRKLAAEIATAAITAVHPAPFALGDAPMFLGCYRFRPTMVSSPEDETLSFADRMCEKLGGRARVTPQDPGGEEIARILEEARQSSALVIGTYNARQRPGQLRLVEAAAKTGQPICVVALRNPYDLAGMPENVYTVAAYDYQPQTLEALADVLSGRKKARGRLPARLTRR